MAPITKLVERQKVVFGQRNVRRPRNLLNRSILKHQY
jgi:hypothetical protein